MFRLNAKWDTESLLYLLSHFECGGHTVHMLTQWCLWPPLTSTVKWLSTHAHSTSLSLAARLHRCRTNHSGYINNGWTFSRQTSYVLELSSCQYVPYLHNFEVLGHYHDPHIFNFLYLIIYNMPIKESFIMKYRIRYATAYSEIKPHSEIRLVLRAILDTSFIAKPLPQPLLLPTNSWKRAMKPPPPLYPPNWSWFNLILQGKRKVSCIGVHCMLLCSKRALPSAQWPPGMAVWY